jgi:hypothetical protein
MSDGRLEWLVFATAWLIGAFGCGAALAWFFRRLDPELSFHKLWAFWTVVLSLAAAVILGLGLL